MLFPSYDSSVTDRQQEWFEEALGHITFPQGLMGTWVEVETVAEPAAEGHSDYMATIWNGEFFTIQIRDGADSLDDPMNTMFATLADLKRFFMEVVAHECGHVWTYTRINTIELQTAACQLFNYGSLNGRQGNYFVDWENPEEGRDRIIEACAEVFKDTYMPKQYRYYTLRNNWKISAANHMELVKMWWRPTPPPTFVGRASMEDASPFGYEVLLSEWSTSGPPLNEGDGTAIEPEITLTQTSADTFESDGTPKNGYAMTFEVSPGVDPDFEGTVWWSLRVKFGSPTGGMEEYATIYFGGSAYDAAGESVGGQPLLYSGLMHMPLQPITTGVGLSFTRWPQEGAYPYEIKEPKVNAGQARAGMVRR